MTLNQAAALPLAELRRLQWRRIHDLLSEIIPSNLFQSSRLPNCVSTLEDFTSRVPLTTKLDLVQDQLAHPPYGSNLTYPVSRYVRLHQTSGTTGPPLRWLDTPESWSWILDSWVRVFESAGVGTGDRIFFPFSFGPFLGFWAAFDAAVRQGWMAIPGGGMRSPARLRMILDNGITVLCATPTYALRLAEVADEENIDLSDSPVRLILLAGEPGGSLPAVRSLIELRWPGARAVDHHGMTETGPVTYQCPHRPGILHVMEAAYFPEVLDPATLQPVPPGGKGELILTNFGRTGSPLLRYRTGDLVRTAGSPCICGSHELALDGGILTRTDDMFVVRGINLYPAAVEAVLRAHGGWAEFRAFIDSSQTLTELRLEVEPEPDHPASATIARSLESALADAFSLRVPVTCVPTGSLPRFELKARRWHRIQP